MPLFSVIIPTYNSAATLEKALSSILNQSFQDYEVIIMDGLSSDASVKIASQPKDDRIVIFSEKDRGVYDAMNKAVTKASGQWLYFLGSDDELYDKEVFEQISQTIAKGSHNFIYGNAYFTSRKIIYGDPFDRQRLKTHNISHQAIFYKKELFERLGKFNTLFKIWADWDFNIRCFSFPDINPVYINLVIVNYCDEGGLSATYVKDEEFVKYLPSHVDEDVIIIRSPLLRKVQKMIPNDFRRYMKRILLGKS